MNTKQTKQSLLLALATSALVAGCASRGPISMTDGATSKIRSTDVIVVLPQQEIAAQIQPSNVAAAGGGGLLLALIDVGINKSRADDAEAALTPVKNALVDYDFPKQLRAALEAEFKRLEWINLQGIRTESSPDASKINAAVASSTANAVLVIRANYALSPDFLQMRISAGVTAFPKTEELTAIAKQTSPDTDPPLLYRNNFTARNSLPIAKAKPSRVAAGTVWAENNGAAAREALNRGTVNLAKAIATDLASARAKARAEGIVDAVPAGAVDPAPAGAVDPASAGTVEAAPAGAVR